MIYACDDCGFLFRRFGRVMTCPVCESGQIRPANEEEAGRLRGFLKLFERDDQKEGEKSK